MPGTTINYPSSTSSGTPDMRIVDKSVVGIHGVCKRETFPCNASTTSEGTLPAHVLRVCNDDEEEVCVCVLDICKSIRFSHSPVNEECQVNCCPPAPQPPALSYCTSPPALQLLPASPVLLLQPSSPVLWCA